MNKVSTHAHANADYVHAVAQYDKVSSSLAARFVDEVEHTIRRIRQGPETFAPYIELPLRYCQVKDFPYVVVYKIQSGSLRILAVHHTSRDDNYITLRS